MMQQFIRYKSPATLVSEHQVLKIKSAHTARILVKHLRTNML